ncbi:TonB-dependent receptor [Algiphilus aromaticivorans]|uniref:TonB-dependent receptor n=1 Tax=Algiphilus aromaticivorans TaxID=382454 RepID=UPI0012EC0419|nr:TonB-dependent receptor [Algiphilus aromaticivorans]
MIRRLHRGAVVVGALFLLALPAAAEEASRDSDDVEMIPVRNEAEAPDFPAPPAEAAPLDEIVVTGQRLQRSLADTTASVGVVDREAIARSSAYDARDLLTGFGNVVGGGDNRPIAIRGVPQDGIGGEGDTISVYLDGVALPPRAASFAGPYSTWDLDQVEVLRGAQSTNRGRNSLAGSVLLRTREPTPYWDLRARAARDNLDGHDYAVAGGGPLGDALRFRIAAQDRYDRGDIYNVTRNEDDAGRRGSRNARFKLSFLPASLPGYEASLGVTLADNEFGDNLHDASQGERTATANERYDERYLSRIYSLRQRLPLAGAWRLEAVTGAFSGDNDRFSDFDRSEEEGGISRFDIEEQLLSQELRLHFDGESVRAVVGAYVADDERFDRNSGENIPAGGGVAMISGTVDSLRETRTAALFAEADWDFAAHWRLTAGLRLNHEKNRHRAASELDLTLTAPVPGLDLPIGVPLPDAASDLLAEAFPDLVPPDYEESGERRFTDLLPKLGLSWRPHPDRNLSLTYSEGYRSGGTSISFFGGEVSEFDPETTRTLELAARSRWLQRRLSVNANVFYTRWRDQQVTVGDPTSFYTTTANAGRSELYGAEVETLARLPWTLEASASLGLLHSEFEDFVNEGEDFAGNEFPFSPDVSASLGLRAAPLSWLRARIGLRYVDGYFSDPSNDADTAIDARTLLNASVDFDLPRGLLLTLYGRNLTDDTNLQAQFVSDGRPARRYGESRLVGARLEWQWQ